ncbi:hypothetical protein ACWDU3_11930, partial [Streptomyces olivaceus]
MSVLLEQPASLVAYRPNKPTAMVVVADQRVRSTVTRHLWALGVLFRGVARIVVSRPEARNHVARWSLAATSPCL